MLKDRWRNANRGQRIMFAWGMPGLVLQFAFIAWFASMDISDWLYAVLVAGSVITYCVYLWVVRKWNGLP